MIESKLKNVTRETITVSLPPNKKRKRIDPLLWMLAFFAGSFLYIGASDLLPEAREHDSPLVGVVFSAGLLAIYSITRFLHT